MALSGGKANPMGFLRDLKCDGGEAWLLGSSEDFNPVGNQNAGGTRRRTVYSAAPHQASNKKLAAVAGHAGNYKSDLKRSKGTSWSHRAWVLWWGDHQGQLLPEVQPHHESPPNQPRRQVHDALVHLRVLLLDDRVRVVTFRVCLPPPATLSILFTRHLPRPGELRWHIHNRVDLVRNWRPKKVKHPLSKAHQVHPGILD